MSIRNCEHSPALISRIYLERGRDVERGVHPAEGVEDVVLDAGAHVLIFLKKYRVNIKRWESVCAGSSIIFLPSE